MGAEVELAELSRLGFGGYRISTADAEHRAALEAALDAGCTLIDTAGSYMGGASERLIGSVIRGRRAFVVTKGGYLAADALAAAVETGLDPAARVDLDGHSAYSLEPEHLALQIALSIERLGRTPLDGYLVHNPEHLLGRGGLTHAELDAVLRRAFAALESEVAAARVRWYGVSSNALTLDEVAPTDLSLSRVLTAAAGREHFRLVEFPLNLVEASGARLIDAAHAAGLVTLSNRPLNALSGQATLRLAEYPDAPDDGEDRGPLDDALTLIGTRLHELGASDDPRAIPVLGHLDANWDRLGTPDDVMHVFAGHVAPLLGELYPERPPPAGARAFRRLHEAALRSARSSVNRSARTLRRALVEAGRIGSGDSRPLATIACATLLDLGVDHVLVGMRRVEYVRALAPLF
jgi:aryl-alcohol dehydrogenase-like predicted oxidoreductase